jgi:hypothetical protein
MTIETWTARALAGVNGVPLPTIGTWRNRYALRLEGDTDSGWSRYGLEDFVRVAIVAELGELGVSAREACSLVNEQGEIIKETCGAKDPLIPEAHGPFLVIRRGMPARITVVILRSPGAMLDAILDKGSAAATITIDLGAARNRMKRLLHKSVWSTEEDEDQSLPLEQRARNTWENDASIRKEFGERFDEYLAYRRANESGLIRSG